jgi:hypothetical protein
VKQEKIDTNLTGHTVHDLTLPVNPDTCETRKVHLTNEGNLTGHPLHDLALPVNPDTCETRKSSHIPALASLSRYLYDKKKLTQILMAIPDLTFAGQSRYL